MKLRSILETFLRLSSHQGGCERDEDHFIPNGIVYHPRSGCERERQ
jgi:hypothetical protein